MKCCITKVKISAFQFVLSEQDSDDTSLCWSCFMLKDSGALLEQLRSVSVNGSLHIQFKYLSQIFQTFNSWTQKIVCFINKSHTRVCWNVVCAASLRDRPQCEEVFLNRGGLLGKDTGAVRPVLLLHHWLTASHIVTTSCYYLYYSARLYLCP